VFLSLSVFACFGPSLLGFSRGLPLLLRNKITAVKNKSMKQPVAKSRRRRRRRSFTT
jgi:hypothetical protein